MENISRQHYENRIFLKPIVNKIFDSLPERLQSELGQFSVWEYKNRITSKERFMFLTPLKHLSQVSEYVCKTAEKDWLSKFLLEFLQEQKARPNWNWQCLN